MYNKKRTKIVATIGPASEKISFLKELLLAGVDVFRFNTKHGEISWHNKKIKTAQKAADMVKRKISILVDLQGPEIRIETKNGQEITVKKRDLLLMGQSFNRPDISLVVFHEEVFKKLKVGDTLFIDDGLIELKVKEKTKDCFLLETIEGGIIRNRKSLNIPESKLNLPSLIDKDLKNLDAIAKSKVDFIALSFVRDKKDINILKKEMKKRKIKAMVVSKVENKSAIENIDEIIEYSDAIMVARGDLGIEMPIEELAYLQKKIISKCRFARKPVIIATQMLYSMVNNPRPTRAEAIDIANSVFDKTDAVMLSEETAIGSYPQRAVSTMSRILAFNEEKSGFQKVNLDPRTETELMVDAAISIIQASSQIEAIIVFTESGYTARIVSAFRPTIKVIAVTENLKTAETLSLSYGIIPFCTSFSLTSTESVKKIINELKKEKLLEKTGDKKRVLLIRGSHKNRPELINSLSMLEI